MSEEYKVKHRKNVDMGSIIADSIFKSLKLHSSPINKYFPIIKYKTNN